MDVSDAVERRLGQLDTASLELIELLKENGEQLAECDDMESVTLYYKDYNDLHIVDNA